MPDKDKKSEADNGEAQPANPDLSGVEEKETAESPTKAETVSSASDEQAKMPKQKHHSDAPKTKSRWGGYILDGCMVLALLGVLGGGGYYLKSELNRYRVPTIMEITMTENLELCKQRESLQAKAYHADEQIHMRKLLSRLELQLGDFSREIAEKEEDITDEHNRVLALQHEIRQADKDARLVARSLLPGMRVGNVSTTTGKAYRDAVIYRIEGKLVTLRCPDGQVRFPLNQLVKDTLPTLARYAFGKEDLIDTSDFEASPMDAAAARQRASKRSIKESAPTSEEEKAKAHVAQEQDYEPAPGSPVVDTDANRTSTNDAPDDAPAAQEDDVWQAPIGDLPL